MKIKRLQEITEKVEEAFQRLIPQLSANCMGPGRDELNSMVHSGNSVLFVAEEDGNIIGTLTLVMYRIPTGIKAWIEDVVVDETMRGKGIGRMLIRHAIDHAKKSGVMKIDLTSVPFRLAANGLNKSMGFARRETNVYRLEL